MDPVITLWTNSYQHAIGCKMPKANIKRSVTLAHGNCLSHDLDKKLGDFGDLSHNL